MPLHLLGKKSWNVYNKDNIARVRRDESEARAKEEAEKQRADSADAKQRLAILREENLLAVEDGDHQNNSNRTRRGGEEYARPTDSCTGPSASLGHGDRSRRPRKHANENDTDYELRLAKQNTNLAYRATTGLQPEHNQRKHTHFSGPITDKAGHIDLFGGAQHLYQHQRSTVPGHHTPRAATAQIDQDEQNQDWLKTRSGMYSSHAVAGRGESGKRGENGSGSGGGSRDALWYASTRISAARTQTAAVEFEAPTYDVWGNDDPRRPQREAARLASIDPLVTMKQASKQAQAQWQSQSQSSPWTWSQTKSHSQSREKT
ncbi:hypothetical protein CFIMG_007487RA00001 [Ceratocystis fimbriata CBS 114723]|uniref:CBF1-interacting co-repressor CIR N-terminal domain-containing protein n=1 Tax=Ceratocystis fimbriata CBS 114723 TaxID=1035309 RepID=A0A2C5XDL6_9PEZI|nr:hypothetical protein CFIMG_007487RA00001 [Ceratocystis fimbriata CBS 114723]